ncbi:MAG TPA: uracil-DNA glycosylase family protein [Xanthobacteraceae bacterium]|nr:uracil-DNA glycosylase family protein [Xanthobacteraceae bacterium]
MSPDQAKAARELLAFYLEAGADAFLGEEPINRLAEPEPEPRRSPARPMVRDAGERPAPHHEAPRYEAPRPRQQTPARREEAAEGARLEGRAAPATPATPEAAIMDARTQARAATSLEELRGILEKFEGCELRRHAKQLVFADGNPQARLMFVGEAPGRDEDLEGLPFVGRSGKLLDLMIKAIGLDRTGVYIANIIPWRPPGNRTPTPQESQICLPFIQRQIELVDPDVLVCLGGPSSQTLLGYTDGIMRTRGRWLAYDTGTREIRATATLHPAYLLRQPLHKRLAWRDFLAIKKALNP